MPLWTAPLFVIGVVSLAAALMIVKPWVRWPRCQWSLALGPHVKVHCLLNQGHTYLRHHWHDEKHPGPPEESTVEWTDTDPRAEVHSVKMDLEEEDVVDGAQLRE